jgi:membrane protein YdbS with pleckstrin-like domain
MNKLLILMFVIFLVWMATGIFLINTEHEKAQIVMGLGILYLSFIFMPLFIFHRYKDGRYKKYIINDEKLRDAFKNVGKDE